MAGPWEKYQQTAVANESGPWTKYAAQAPDKPQPGAGTAALEGFGNAATLGYLPQIQAAVEPAFTKGMNLLTGNDVPVDGDYTQRRDENIKRLEQQKKDFPGAAIGGEVGGALVSGIATAPLLPFKALLGAKAAKTAVDATRAQRLIAATKALALRTAGASGQGAVMGAAYNPGDKEGEIAPFQIDGRAANSGVGAFVGGALNPAIEGGVVAAKGLLGATKSAGKVLGDKAALKAMRAVGRPTPTVAAKMADTGQDLVIGRELLDSGAIPMLGTPAKIQSNIESLKERAGKQVGDIIDAAQESMPQYTPIKITKPRGGVTAKEEVLATPIRIEENPLRKTMPWVRAEDAPPSIIRGEVQPVQSRLVEASPYQITHGKAQPIKPIDAAQLADDIRSSPDLKQMMTTPGMEGAAAKIEQTLQTLGKNGKISLKEAQTLRQQIDRSINFNKRIPDMTGAQEGLYMQRTALRNKMNDVINTLSPSAEKDALLSANRRYGNLSQASDIAEREAGRQQANRAISLTDTIAGAAGATSGNPALALGLGALNKAGRTFGNSVQARAYDAMYKLTQSKPLASLLSSAPEIASEVQKNPQILPGLIKALKLPEFEGSLAPAFAENDKPKSGPERWAYNGIEKLGLSGNPIAEKLMNSKEGKQLLIEASDLAPDSSAMKRIRDKITKGFGGDYGNESGSRVSSEVLRSERKPSSRR